MRIKPRGDSSAENVLTVRLEPGDRLGPVVRAGERVLSLGAALITYEVIDASPEERQLLARVGVPSGGLQ